MTNKIAKKSRIAVYDEHPFITKWANR